MWAPRVWTASLQDAMRLFSQVPNAVRQHLQNYTASVGLLLPTTSLLSAMPLNVTVSMGNQNIPATVKTTVASQESVSVFISISSV
jgi:hypothetical protein